MSVLTALKVLADLSLLASAAAVVVPWFSLTLTNLFPAMLCCAGGILGAALLDRRGIARYAGVLPCALALLGCHSRVDLIAVVPMIAYCVLLIHRDLLTVSYDAYHEFFPKGTLFLVFCFVFASINMDWLPVLPYIAAYLILGVYILRVLRLDHLATPRNVLLNALAMCGALLVGGGLCVAAYLVLLLRFPVVAGFQWIMLHVLDAVEELVYLFGELIMYLVMYVVALIYSRRNGEVEMEGTGGGEKPAEPPQMTTNTTAGAIAGAVILLAGAILLILLVRKALRAMTRRRGDTGRRVRMERIHEIGDRQGEKVTGNRARVRAVYRRFLRLMLDRGAEIPSNATSEDILRSSALVADGADCAALREVYIAARYDPAREVTAEQVKEAKSIYGRLKDVQ